MGFDPRSWSPASDHHSRQRVTTNVDALLAENDALRKEVQRLQRQLDHLRQQQRQHDRQQRSEPQPQWRRPWQEQPPARPKVSTLQVERWGESLAQQKGWSALRKQGLEGLIEELNRCSFHPQLTLQQRLDRLHSGLGHDLLAAVGSPLNKKRCAVLAAFALYGVRGGEWLDEDPRRVVLELKTRQQQEGRSRRPRSDTRSTDQKDSQKQKHKQTQPFSRIPRDQASALQVLGLPVDASLQMIKQAHRRLVKQHHPDMGGSAEAFHCVNEAYQLLTA